MISPNKLAQYWVGFGHISFYERVNIDAFINPLVDHAGAGPPGRDFGSLMGVGSSGAAGRHDNTIAATPGLN